MQKLVLTIIITAFFGIASWAQVHSKALAASDSTSFSVNKKDGWLLYNSLVAPWKSDSVVVGLILQHDRNINWNQEQQVGKIKQQSLFPQVGQTITIILIQDTYQFRVDKNGKCYLRLVSGSIPGESGPVILPVKVKYKK